MSQSSGRSEDAAIVVVPHTHWDREWYEPHDVFRLRLVHMVDGLLDLLEREPDYRFTLDGQAAAIDDYLEIRPESRDRVQRAVDAGQLAIGPFLILLDEFCCDGETIIRNLELGIRSSRELGDEMRVGYLPDMFGHAAQTPQILNGFGIRDTSLWRGVPAAIHQHAFTWQSPDGSRVRCQYLFDGYGNGLDLFALEGQLPVLARQYVEATRDWRGGDEALAMLGSDHTAPMPDLMQRIAEAGGDPGAPEIRVDTIEGYIRSQASHRDLPVVGGELRSHARGNLLPGVFSIRTNLKQAMSDAERAVNIAERMDALFPGRNHQRFLDTAWYRIVESTAHDSVTGCGVDATAQQVGTRLATAAHIARAVTETALKHAAADVLGSEYLVVNSSSFPRRAHVEITVGGVRAKPGNAQVLESSPTTLGDEHMSTRDLPKLLRRIHGRELFGQQINDYEWGENTLRFDVAEVPVGDFDLAAFTSELHRRVAANPADRQWHVLTIAAPRKRVLVEVPLRGLGVALASEAQAPIDPVTADESGLRNASLVVTINADGTVNLAGRAFRSEGVLRLVDEGDRGDSYNFGPVAGGGAVDVPSSVQVTVLETGPIRGRIRVDRTYALPTGIDPADPDHRLPETAGQLVSTFLELRSGEDFLRVTVDLVNAVRDHRLRLLVPVGARDLGTSASAGQYSVTERGREGEGGWGEYPLPTYPATQFVSAGNATVLLDKLTEYELITEPGTGPDMLALTLVRAVGMMSVNIHPLRDEPAGSQIPVPGAQMLGERIVTRLALLPSPGGWQAAGAPRQADLFRFDPQVARGQASVPEETITEPTAPLPAVQLQTNGAVPLTSLRLRRDADGRVADRMVRFVNYDWSPRPLECETSCEWTRTDMAGELASGAQCVSGTPEGRGSGPEVAPGADPGGAGLPDGLSGTLPDLRPGDSGPQIGASVIATFVSTTAS